MSFDAGDMVEALPDISNEKPAAPGPPKDQEAFEAARQKGWVAPTAYDYSSNKNTAPAVATGIDGDAAAAAAEGFAPQWAHQAEKYEWKEEYGDVGPRVPALEQQLFESELIMRKGINMKE